MIALGDSAIVTLLLWIGSFVPAEIGALGIGAEFVEASTAGVPTALVDSFGVVRIAGAVFVAAGATLRTGAFVCALKGKAANAIALNRRGNLDIKG